MIDSRAFRSRRSGCTIASQILRRSSLDVALACLAHPVSLVALAVLVSNDHVLKAAAPGWWTGKLSDFAGLVFFPALLAVALSPFASARLAGPLSVGVTALWFVSIKTNEVANAATEGLVEALTGAPSTIVRDPTDAIALVSLGLALRLWKREAQRPASRRTRRRAGVAAAGLAALATMATSVLRPPSIVHVVDLGDELLAIDGIEPFEIPAEGLQLSPAWDIFVSSDGGRTWRDTHRADVEAPEWSWKVERPPEVVQDPNDPGQWFRITQGSVIERSSDAGRSWETDWEIAASRRAFYRRDSGHDLRLHGMTFPSRHPGRLLVAAGPHGILMRDARGRWTGIAVGTAGPGRTVTRAPAEIVRSVGGELLWIGLLTTVFAPALSAAAWILLSRERRREARSTWLLCAGLLMLSPAIGLGLLVVSEEVGDPGPPLLLAVTPLVSLGVYLLALLWPWRRFVRLAPRGLEARRSRARWWQTSLALLVLPMLPLLLWPPGVIAWYPVALGLAVAAFVASAVAGSRAAIRWARRAALPPDP